MAFIARSLSGPILTASRHFPAIVLTGPRRSGKTSLLREIFPQATYVLLEDPDIQSRTRSDPRGLLDEFKLPVLFDEIQNVPQLFDYVRTRIDEHPRRFGQYLFTGSQEAPLMQGVTESMAGRAAVLQLLPLSLAESRRVSLLLGGFPEVIARPAGRALWFSSYLQTYLERDVRAITSIRDLGTFRRFLAMLASRHGQILNRTDLAAPLGVSVPTVDNWLHILEITGQVILAPPYFENFGKRLIKSPKIYIGDSGLACYLLGITSAAELERSPFLGALYEGFIAAEILKSQINAGRRKELYHFRDRPGLEVDFLFPDAHGTLHMVECKSSKTAKPEMASRMLSLRRAMDPNAAVHMTLVHRPSSSDPPFTTLAPGVEALATEAFVKQLHQPPAKAHRAR
jgi:hypothetical protein